MGGLNEWSAGGAIELSPKMAVGLALIYYHGNEDYLWQYSVQDLGPVTRNDDNIQSHYSGVGLRLGMLVEANRFLTFGFSLDSPTRFNISQEYTQVTSGSGVPDEVVGSYEYKLQQPFILNAGAAFRSEQPECRG